jgi:DNA-binding NarL/FixJ family response regulator
MRGIVAPGPLEDTMDSKGATRAALHPGERSDLSGLSGREAQVVGLVADGLANKDIARRLRISEGTVKAHLSAVFAKFGVRNRTQAALIVHEWRHRSRNDHRPRW